MQQHQHAEPVASLEEPQMDAATRWEKKEAPILSVCVLAIVQAIVQTVVQAVVQAIALAIVQAIALEIVRAMVPAASLPILLTEEVRWTEEVASLVSPTNPLVLSA